MSIQGILSSDKWGGSDDRVVRAILVGTGYEPAAGAERTELTYGAVSANEIMHTGYTATGQVLSKTNPPVLDATLNKTWYDGTLPSLGTIASGVNVRWLIFFEWDAGTPANSEYLGRIDLRDYNSGADVPSNGTPFEITFSNGHVFFQDW